MEPDDIEDAREPEWATAAPTDTIPPPPGATPPPGDPPPPPGPPHGSAPLTRSSSDRLLAGVAGGLGRYFGLDPVLFRIGFVVLGVVGGTGIALYLLGWLLLPEEDGTDSVAATALRGKDRRGRARAILGLAVAALLITEPFRHRFWTDGVLWPIVLIGLGFALLHSRHPQAGGTNPGPVPPWTAGPGGADTSWPGSGPPWPTGTGTAAWVAPDSRPNTLTAYLAGGLAILCAGAALLQLTGALDISLAGFLASALAVSGVALVAGAVRGRVGGPIVLVTLLLAGALASVLAVPVSIGGGIGNRLSHPADVAAVMTSNHLGIGDLTLDLSDVHPDQTLAVKASVGIGELRVIVPDGATVITRGRAGTGEVEVFDGREGGLSVDRNSQDQGTGPETFKLDLRVGIGQVEVERAGA
jgi:phage shock protein PspC (stress-responsive transcriptional regulator)